MSRRGPDVPDEMARELLRLQIAVPARPGSRYCDESRRLDWALLTANRAGWSYSALARVLNTSGESVRQRVERATPFGPPFAFPTPDPVEPQPIRRPTRTGPGRPVPKRVDESTARRLRELHAVARNARGPMRRDHPARVASEQLTALMAELIEREYTIYHLAKVLGITFRATRIRLVRHGYLEPVASDPVERYRGGRAR